MSIGRAPFGQNQESRTLARSVTWSPRFTDFPPLCACSESRLANFIGSDLNALSSPEAALLLVSTKNRDLAKSNTGSPRFTDFTSLCACSESSLTKSEWFWSQSIVFIKPFKNGMSLGQARGRDSWCWPKGARPLGTRMISMYNDLKQSRSTPKLMCKKQYFLGFFYCIFLLYYF